MSKESARSTHEWEFCHCIFTFRRLKTNFDRIFLQFNANAADPTTHYANWISAGIWKSAARNADVRMSFRSPSSLIPFHHQAAEEYYQWQTNKWIMHDLLGSCQIYKFHNFRISFMDGRYNPVWVPRHRLENMQSTLDFQLRSQIFSVQSKSSSWSFQPRQQDQNAAFFSSSVPLHFWYSVVWSSLLHFPGLRPLWVQMGNWGTNECSSY